MCGHDFAEENEDENQGEKRSLLMHGVPSDWVEEEMMEDDVDFIRDVLEQKIIKVLENVGIKKRVRPDRNNIISMFSCVTLSLSYVYALD